MVHSEKLLTLVEQNVNGGKGVRGYREQFRSLLGLTEGPNGDLVLDTKAQELKASDFSFQEIAMSFLGRNYASKLSDVQHLAHMGRLFEADGHVVAPSHFSNISAFTDTVAGLIDAMVLEAYQSPEFIGDSLFTTKEARVNGGKMIGVMNDGGVNSASLLDGEPYPTVGLKETYVEVPNNERYGNVIQVGMKTFLYDRTDQIQSACTAAGDAVRRKKEVRQADCFLGITNTYSRDGNSANTYLTVASDVPNNYVNSSTNELVDWKDIDEAVQVLEGNTDPGTGFEITVEPPYDLLVMPQKYLTAATIVRSTNMETRTQTSTEIRRFDNPLYAINLIRATRLWYNRLIAASVSTTNAPARWHMGHFRKAFMYRQIVPFGVTDAPLSSEDVRRDVVLIKVAMEHGVPFVTEPRYSYQGTKE